jgi:hypothetical protein
MHWPGLGKSANHALALFGIEVDHDLVHCGAARAYGTCDKAAATGTVGHN